jgi:hypothetical protein
MIVTGVPADGLGRLAAHLGERVGEHDHRLADLQLRVADLAARCSHPEALGRVEDGLVEVDRAGRVVDREVGNHLRVAVRDRFHLGNRCLL